LLNKPHSAIWLIYVIFITSLILGALAIYSSLQIVLASSGNVSANSTSIEGGYNYGALASHPLVLLLIGLLFTGLIIPAVSKQWRKPKELELKVNVISRIGESVANIISAVHLDQVTQLTPHQDFKKAQIKWETDKEVIAAHLQVLFPGSPIIDKWQTFSFAVSALHSLNETSDRAERQHYLDVIQQMLGIAIASTNLQALIDRPRQGPGVELYMDSFLDLKETFMKQMNSIVDLIRKSKIASI
jgi:hypothetical protein